MVVGNGIIPPNINYQHPDPELDLNYTPTVRPARRQRLSSVNSSARWTQHHPGHQNASRAELMSPIPEISLDLGRSPTGN